jgi:hypothetical protein
MTAQKPAGPHSPKPATVEAGEEREARLASALRQNLRRRKAQKSARKSDESDKPGARDDVKGRNRG